MTTITITLSDDRALKLQELAARYVLTKNAELYRRLDGSISCAEWL